MLSLNIYNGYLDTIGEARGLCKIKHKMYNLYYGTA